MTYNENRDRLDKHTLRMNKQDTNVTDNADRLDHHEGRLDAQKHNATGLSNRMDKFELAIEARFEALERGDEPEPRKPVVGEIWEHNLVGLALVLQAEPDDTELQTRCMVLNAYKVITLATANLDRYICDFEYGAGQ